MILASAHADGCLFQALGVDKVQAEQAILDAWDRYCDLDPGANPDSMTPGDINYDDINPGAAICDGSPI